MTKKPDRSTKLTDLRKQAKEQLRTTRRDVAAMPVKDVQQIVHELPIHQIEMERQNEELRRAQVELESTRDRYTDLYDFSPAGHLTLDTSGTIVEGNLRAATLLGIDRNELIGQSLAHLVASDDQDRFDRHREEVLKTGTRQTCDVHLRKQAGASRWASFDSLAVHDEQRHITHWWMVVLDITARKQADVELNKSEERYRTLFESSQDAIMTLAPPTWDFTSGNPAAVAMFLAQDEAEFVSLASRELSPELQPDGRLSADKAKEMIDTAMRERSHFFEWMHKRLTGEEFPATVLLTCMEIDGVLQLQATVHDISDRKRAENAEQRRTLQLKICQEELYALAKNQAFHAGQLTHSLQMVTECATRTPAVERGSVWFLDETGSFLLLHDLYEATAKRHTSGMRLSRSLFPSYFHALKTETCTIDAEDALTDPRTCEFAEAYLIPLNIGAMLDAPIWRDGQVVGVLCLEQIGGARIWTKEEQVFVSSLAAMVTIALEADERRKAQDRLEQRVVERTGELQRVNLELHRATTHLHAILAQSPLAIIELDETGFVKRWNNAATQTFGWTEEEVLGRELSYLPQGEKEASSSPWTSVMQGEMGQNRELLLQKKDGVPVNVSVWSIDLRDPDGSPTGSIGFLIDITERKRLETRGRQAQKMEAVGQLAGGMAHDFNNLLTVIYGNSALLMDKLPPDDPRYALVAETLAVGERAGELTRQLLAFSRQQVLSLQPLNLNDSIQSISSMLSRLLGENVTLTLDLAPDLWSINGDKGQLDQIMMNLAANARDAMSNGGILAFATDNLTMTPEAPDPHRVMPVGNYVHLRVSDTGHGMSEETRTHLFEPFFTTKEVGQGTGLGLATVYGIVKQSQGYIFVDSALNEGTTFHLYYPRVAARAVQAAPPTAGHTTGSETVFVVEDQEMVRTAVVQALKSYGYRVIEAANGEDALRAAASLPEPVQVLVTDVIMPQMSGPVLAERLRLVWPGLRVLFMSGYTDRAAPVLNEPGTAFIQKPFMPNNLSKLLRDLLDRSIQRGEDSRI